eukprot:4492707-Prymnesium_polylepis.1
MVYSLGGVRPLPPGHGHACPKRKGKAHEKAPKPSQSARARRAFNGKATCLLHARSHRAGSDSELHVRGQRPIQRSAQGTARPAKPASLRRVFGHRPLVLITFRY